MRPDFSVLLLTTLIGVGQGRRLPGTRSMRTAAWSR
jgi:hypothetical protein